MATALQSTESAAKAISRVKYSHDAMIDLLIADPAISQGKIAEIFGYTQAWVSRVMCSDAFNARLAERKTEMVDPTIRMTIEEKFKAATTKSLEIVMDKLEKVPTVDTAFKMMEIGVKALGLGARQANVSVQNSFVVALPGKSESAKDWAAEHGQGGQIIEGEEV